MIKIFWCKDKAIIYDGNRFIVTENQNIKQVNLKNLTEKEVFTMLPEILGNEKLLFYKYCALCERKDDCKLFKIISDNKIKRNLEKIEGNINSILKRMVIGSTKIPDKYLDSMLEWIEEIKKELQYPEIIRLIQEYYKIDSIAELCIYYKEIKEKI